MKCPLCKVEGRIEKSDLVINEGSVSYRIQYKCRTKSCANYNTVFHTDYDPVNLVPDSKAPVSEVTES